MSANLLISALSLVSCAAVNATGVLSLTVRAKLIVGALPDLALSADCKLSNLLAILAALSLISTVAMAALPTRVNAPVAVTPVTS